VSAETPFEVIKITEGGSYNASAYVQQFIVDTNGNVALRGSPGRNKYTIIPHPFANITIQNFKNTEDLIDLSLFKGITSLDRISYLTYPVVLLLTGNQRVILPSYENFVLSESNFIFSEKVEQPSEYSSHGVDLSVLTPDVVISVTVFGALLLLTMLLYQLKHNEKLMKWLLTKMKQRKSSVVPLPGDLKFRNNYYDMTSDIPDSLSSSESFRSGCSNKTVHDIESQSILSGVSVLYPENEFHPSIDAYEVQYSPYYYDPWSYPLQPQFMINFFETDPEKKQDDNPIDMGGDRIISYEQVPPFVYNPQYLAGPLSAFLGMYANDDPLEDESDCSNIQFPSIDAQSSIDTEDNNRSLSPSCRLSPDNSMDSDVENLLFSPVSSEENLPLQLNTPLSSEYELPGPALSSPRFLPGQMQESQEQETFVRPRAMFAASLPVKEEACAWADEQVSPSEEEKEESVSIRGVEYSRPSLSSRLSNNRQSAATIENYCTWKNESIPDDDQ
jgi:hypothetical protein